MPIGIKVTPDREGVRQIEDAFARLRRAGGNQREVLGLLGIFIRREAQRRLRSRKREWGPTTFRLGKSLAMRLDNYSVTVGSNLVYAAIQQLGGDVRPKRKYLAIPVNTTLRRRGVWPRDLPDDQLKFVPNAKIRIGSRSWTGPALVRAKAVEIQTTGDGAGRGTKRRRAKSKEGEVLFALVKRVRIKGRPYLVFDDAARQFLFGQILRSLRRAAGGGRT